VSHDDDDWKPNSVSLSVSSSRSIYVAVTVKSIF